MSEPQPFVTYLESLREDRAALACLRRGLGQPPGTVVDMFPYVARWVAPDAPRSLEEAHYLIAALFASHPAAGGAGNMGDHFRRVIREDERSADAVERRFTALLAAHPDDLPFYLRQAVSFLRAREVPVNWHQLYSDIRRWGRPERWVQRRWARSFWGHSAEAPQRDKEA
ncbi:MAG: type I-E CRISPR-associated protein Cse2/CasB [Anaerolineae bacterium]|nr:type I-E CRISPR-associated protein Cse2/CasB [Anaerolineae bacterium]